MEVDMNNYRAALFFLTAITAVEVNAGVSLYMCNEPLLISNCELEHNNSPTCTYQNTANVPFSATLKVYAYDNNNTQLGTDGLVFIRGLQPGQSIRKDTFLSEGKNATKIVFCTLDPYTEVTQNNLKFIY